jgi:hypothetical protein
LQDGDHENHENRPATSGPAGIAHWDQLSHEERRLINQEKHEITRKI